LECDDGVLWLHYDDLKADLKGCIKLISSFMGIGVGDQKLLDLVHYQVRSCVLFILISTIFWNAGKF